MDDRVDLAEAFTRFDDRWSPRIVAGVNDYDVKIAKVEGAFAWHAHPETDELFLVTRGELRLRLEGRDDVVLGPGQLYVVPRGQRHLPVADDETHIVMFEPRGTVNAGDSDRPGTTGRPLE
jgi:mannose-6-phosphate isomerase-like protein (cupin superfamily)